MQVAFSASPDQESPNLISDDTKSPDIEPNFADVEFDGL